MWQLRGIQRGPGGLCTQPWEKAGPWDQAQTGGASCGGPGHSSVSHHHPEPPPPGSSPSPGMQGRGPEGGLTRLPSLPLETWPSGSARYSCAPVCPVRGSAHVLSHGGGQGNGQHTDHQPAPGGFHGPTVETRAGPGQAGRHTLVHTQLTRLDSAPPPHHDIFMSLTIAHIPHPGPLKSTLHPAPRTPQHTHRTTNSHRLTHTTDHTHRVTHSDTRTQLLALAHLHNTISKLKSPPHTPGHSDGHTVMCSLQMIGSFE